MKPVRTLMTAVVATTALAVAASANAATISLAIDPAQTSATSRPVKSGGLGYMAPSSIFTFEATVTNDAGQIPLPSGDNSATVDLIARTASGDKVVSRMRVTNTLPVSFPPQFLNQTTRYYARVNAAPANGIAAPKSSSMILLRAFLRNTHVVYPSKGAVGFAGIYPQVPGVSLPRSVRVLVQRRVGTKWVTLVKTGPDRRRSWAARVVIGKVPAVFRVRTVPVAPARFLPATELRYCVASTAARARTLCRSVRLGLNEVGSPTRVIAVAADD